MNGHSKPNEELLNLKPTKSMSYTDENNCSDSVSDVSKSEKEATTVDKRLFLLANLAVIFLTFSSKIDVPLMDPFLYYYYAKVLLGNDSLNLDITSHPCFDHNTSANESSKEMQVRLVQDMTSKAVLQFETMASALAIFPAFILGTFSTLISRKWQMLIPASGVLIRSVMIPIVIYTNIDVQWLSIGFVAEGATGGMTSLTMGFFLYTTDVTPRDSNRTLCVTIMESVRGVMSAVAKVVTGYLLQNYGFLLPACLSPGCLICSMAIICLLPQRQPKLQTLEKRTFKKEVKDVLLTFGNLQNPLEKKMIFLSCFGIFLFFIQRGALKIVALYLMSLPFCWDAITIGWFSCVRQLAINIFPIFGVPLLHPYLPGFGFGIVCSLTTVIVYLILAFAQKDLDMYFVPILDMGRSVPLNLMRGETSRLLGPEHQGKLFAMLAVFETVGSAIGKLAISIYVASLYFFPGLIFLVLMVIMLITTGILTVCHVMWREHISKSILYEELEVSAE